VSLRPPTDQPKRFYHNCPACIYLGRWQLQGKGAIYDTYICRADDATDPSILLRWNNRPEDYVSMHLSLRLANGDPSLTILGPHLMLPARDIPWLERYRGTPELREHRTYLGKILTSEGMADVDIDTSLCSFCFFLDRRGMQKGAESWRDIPFTRVRRGYMEDDPFYKDLVELNRGNLP
jgi:hypothetical protein